MARKTRQCRTLPPWPYPGMHGDGRLRDPPVVHWATACRCGWHREGLTREEAERLTIEHEDENDPTKQ